MINGIDMEFRYDGCKRLEGIEFNRVKIFQ